MEEYEKPWTKEQVAKAMLGSKSELNEGLNALVPLWENRWRNCLLQAEQLGKRGKYYEAAERKIQANAFMDAAKELKEKLGI